MVLPRNKFDSYNPGADKYASSVPQLKLADLEPAFTGEPKLSILISTWNRRGQLSRSLECLARQEWKEFEVLLMDDGSTENISSLFDTFVQFLQIKKFRIERTKWHSCPSAAIKYMQDYASGEVIAIMHPEIMLHKTATDLLYRGCVEEIEGVTYFIETEYVPTDIDWKWVSLRPQFIHADQYHIMDTVDWHEDVDNLQKLPNFSALQGFAGRPNSWHKKKEQYPWWFVGAAREECPIWDDMPVIDGHGIIDMWMMRYRKDHRFMDVVPSGVLCYHQSHQTSAIAPKGEQESVA